MGAGQGVLSGASDDAARAVFETRLQVQEAERGAHHVGQLRTVLEMHAFDTDRGLGLSTVPHAALSLGCSEHRASVLLTDGLGLAELPGALEAVECGLLTVEQATTVVKQLSVLPLTGRVAVWRRLQERLIAESDAGSVLPPARLTELLRRWVVAADPDDAVARRRKAEKGRTVDYRLRPDGLGDLFGSGFRAPDLHAILSRIAARSAPWGAGDDRTAEQRRFDAFRDLLLGREGLPLDGPDAAVSCREGHQAPPRGASVCGCLPGQPVPCGAALNVHIPHGGALGLTDEPAELAGHGPLEPDLLAELLLSAPRLRPVWVDDHGTPVAVGDRVVVPRRGDPGSVREALLRLAGMPPPPPQPRRPHDHPPPDQPADPVPPSGSAPDGCHPAGRPPRWLRRLIDARAPRCEWPGCGARAVRCDAEHDRAWPDGPTCACNLGPCCRRHHQVKQHGWAKTRTPTGVRWTAQTGRSWLGPSQHDPPDPPVRPLPRVPMPSPLDELSPRQLEDELAALDLLPDDDWSSHLTPVDLEPADLDSRDTDRLGQRLRSYDTAWSLDFADPYRWLAPEPAPA